MFKFLKEKLKKAISSIGKKIEKEAEAIEEKPKPQEEIKEPIKKPELEPEKEIKTKPEEKKEKFSLFKKKKKEIIEEPKKKLEQEVKETKKKEPIKEEKPEIKKIEEIIKKPEVKQRKEEPPIEGKKSFFEKFKEKITTKKISEDTFEELFYELEIALLENNVALEVIDKIKEDLKKELVNKPLPRADIEKTIKESLKKSIEDLFLIRDISIINKIKEKKDKPFVIVFFGQNGSGKTTSIAKIANYLQKHKISVVLAASDTFRAASIHQLKEWGDRLKVKVIAHDYGSDPAAVAFDGIKFCQAHKIDVLLIDTAGRQHSNINLMKEMEKIVRIAKPDLKIFIGEAIVGNDAVQQAEDFNKAIGIDGSILTKADVDEKGGAIVSISYITKKPILFLGVGQRPSDLKEFSKEETIQSLGF